jgi:hypothetical protein
MSEPFKCETKGGIRAVLITPWEFGKTDAQIIAEAEPFIQIGDAMAVMNESVKFGDEIVYIKLSE